MLLGDLINPFTDLRKMDWTVIVVMLLLQAGFLYLVAITVEFVLTWVISLFLA